jgi:membrane fusion protein, multidrug efflux system
MEKPNVKYSFLITSTAVLAGALMLLGACAKEAPKPDVVRPVRTLVLSPQAGDLMTFAGEVRPRYETALAFRVPGQIVTRRVEVGSVVKRGQVLAVLDATDLKLAKSAARARLTQAESQATLADADFKRYSELRAKNFISQAEFDRREAQVRQAREAVAAARAEYEQLVNRVDYGTLLAPHAGVIAGIEAEVGQVVAAGQPVARLAREDEKEVAFSVPEHLLAAVKTATDIEIRLWSQPDVVLRGRVRELSPIADPASRTYPARVSILGDARAVALGMSADLRMHANSAESLRVPLTALFHQQDHPAVWVVEGTPLTARLAPVTTGAIHGDNVDITSGLVSGQTIVTAGVNMLAAGQKVKLLEDTKLSSASR